MVDTIFTGDVLRHANSGRVGVVLEIRYAYRNHPVEYRVQTPCWEDDEPYEIWWSAPQVARVRGRDPYRRYLALCAVEDDPAKQARRAAHPRRRVRWCGGWLPERVWEALYWRLCNRRRLLPTGEYVHYPLGRGHWEVAALDCLERRDRASRYWVARSPVPPGVRP